VAKRIPQEKHWLDNRDAGRVEVYVGRLADNRTPDDEAWDLQIRLAERVLIHTHSPPMNTQKSLGGRAADLRQVHVLNWGYHRDPLQEVSGTYWASIGEDFPTYHVFGE
jgi:hypothetical protein